nr:starch-binding protein [uncultured Prevotella sp.]
MKKRFTLMMMVLCFLMSIPLKMMAETVTIHFVDKESTKWESYAAYVYDRTIKGNGSQPWVTDKWPGQKVTNSADIETLANGYKVVTWKIDLKSCALSNALVIFNNQDNGKQCPASGQPGKGVKNGYYYYSDGTMSDTAPSGTETGGGSGTGSGSGSTPVDWNTVNTNRLKNHVYTQGFYLAGNFFTFDEKDKINYDDAVFKFQQQNDQSISEAAITAYDVYMVEIPASLNAHAQVMYVDKTGKAVKLFFPLSTCSISVTHPETAKSTDWKTLTGTEVFPDNNTYWDFLTRNKNQSEYSDGLYEVYIAVDKKDNEPKMWKITHQAKKRVAYFISDAPDATAVPLYDAYTSDDQGGRFYNKFFATVNLAANRSYYVISNYVNNHEFAKWASSYGAIDTGQLHAISCPTTNKLFMLGNGGVEYTSDRPQNEVLPNEAPVKINKRNFGVQIVEYDPTKGDNTRCQNTNHFGFIGEIQLRTDREVLTSVSLVGDAIPGTLNADGTWNYKSNAADMVYDETEQCYKARVVTTVDDNGQSKFRFVGNHNPLITWFEDTDGTDRDKMAKTPYKSTDPDVHGHTADANDPNQVNYTQKGANSEKDYHIIWNRPAGRWTVRLYFYTYSDGTDHPVTDYYYTITANSDMELHDFGDVVYGSETNKQNITNLGRYRYMRTWSAEKAWKISDQVDIFVVSAITEDKSGVKMILKNINGYVSGVDRVIPPKTGVILATTSEAASNIPGAKFKSREDFTSYNNLVIPMEQYDTDLPYNGDNLLEKIIYSRVIPPFEDNKYNYLFGYYNTRIATGDETCDKHNYLLGFWISKGSKPYLSNSSYLPIDKETAVKMKYLGTSHKDYVYDDGGSAKKIPALLFDFDNVGGTTGINEVVNQSTKLNDGKYYTLSGQQVEKPTAGGIYIHNGRKFVVK